MSCNDDIVIYLIGNKKDLEKERCITALRGNNKSKKLKFNKFGEISAKTMENLKEIFKDFYMEIYKKNKSKVIDKRKQNLKTFETIKKESNSGCC